MKKTLLYTILSIILLLVIIGSFVYIVDPYQQYRKSDNFIGNQRLEIAGVAKHHDYNAIITGSSMAMNHSPEIADSLWGWKTMNFTVMGGMYDDFQIMLPYVISQDKVKNIIIGLDFFSFSSRRGVISKYLYDDNIWNNYQYLWNYTSIKNAINFLYTKISKKNLYHFSSECNKDVLFKDYVNHTDKGYPDLNFDYEYMKENFDNSIIQILDTSPVNIIWYVYFPPYSIYEFIVYDNMGKLGDILNLKKYIINMLGKYKNVHIFDFQCRPWITDSNSYMDLRHHCHQYNKDILIAIHRNEYRFDTNKDNLKGLVNAYRDSLNNYNIP